MPAEGKLNGIALHVVDKVKEGTGNVARGNAQVLNKFSGAGRGAARTFERENDLAENQLRIYSAHAAVGADGRTRAGRRLVDLTRELEMRSRLRELERQKWKLAQRLESRPGDVRLNRRLNRVEREHRQLETEVAAIVAARSTSGTQPWKVDNSPQGIGELRDWENRRQQARDGVETLKLQRDDLRIRRDDLRLRRDDLRAELRGEPTRPSRSVEGRAGALESRAAAKSRWQAMETRYDDSTVARLRDLKGAQQNVEWMTGQLARQEKALAGEIEKLERDIGRTERDIGRMENELAKQRAQLEQKSRQPEHVLVAHEGPAGPSDLRGNQQANAQERQDQGRVDKAQEKVSEAAEKAKKAQERVGEAEEKAKVAQEKADKVKEEGQKQRRVDSAQGKADKAQEKVERAQENADQAREKVSRAQEKVEHAKEKDKAKADRAEEKERKQKDKEQKKAETKEKRAAHWRSAGVAGVGIATGAAAAFGVSAAIDSGVEDSGGRAAKDAAGRPGPEKAVGDSGAEDAAGVDSGAEDDAGVDSGYTGGAGVDWGYAGGSGADSGYAGGSGSVSAGSEQGSAPDSGSGPASGAGVDSDASTGRSDENIGALDEQPSPGSSGSDQPAIGIPVGGGQQFDPADLLLPLLLSNLPDTGSADLDPDEDGEYGTDPGPGAQSTSVPPAPQQAAPTPWTRQPSVDQSPATEPPGRPAEVPPRSVVPASPAGTRDDRKGVVYTHTGDNVTESVPASVAAAYDRAYENKTATDAKAAYAGTAAEWADEKALARVDPNDLTSGDIITFDNGTALVRVQKAAGRPDDGAVDVIIEGELMPIAAVMADGAGALGGFAGFRRPPGIEMPTSDEHGADRGPAPATDDRSEDADAPE